MSKCPDVQSLPYVFLPPIYQPMSTCPHVHIPLRLQLFPATAPSKATSPINTRNHRPVVSSHPSLCTLAVASSIMYSLSRSSFSTLLLLLTSSLSRPISNVAAEMRLEFELLELRLRLRRSPFTSVFSFRLAKIRLSLPRPLMPLLLFLYSVAKYSHSSLSIADTASPSRIDANLIVKFRRVSEWNLFW